MDGIVSQGLSYATERTNVPVFFSLINFLLRFFRAFSDHFRKRTNGEEEKIKKKCLFRRLMRAKNGRYQIKGEISVDVYFPLGRQRHIKPLAHFFESPISGFKPTKQTERQENIL